MTDTVTVVDTPDLRASRRAFVLAEDRVGHYPEFRAFFDRTFDLARVGLSRPGYLHQGNAQIFHQEDCHPRRMEWGTVAGQARLCEPVSYRYSRSSSPSIRHQGYGA